MTDSTILYAFLGDSEHKFQLTPEAIAELERLCECGIGAIFKRVGTSQFTHKEIVQTIRLALVGGGMLPETATSFCRFYVEAQPISVPHLLAVQILNATFNGSPFKAPVPEPKGVSSESV